MDFADNLKKYANVRTISIAFPSSIFDNTPTPQLEAYLVGQVARAAVVFNIAEIIIFDEPDEKAEQKVPYGRTERLVKLFEYAECPQYLRKRIFAIEPDLKFAGMIHPLESQHHLRTSQLECPYREGVTMKHVLIEENNSRLDGKDFTQVNIGLNKPAIVPGSLELGTRVTLKLDPHDLRKVQAMLGQTTMDGCPQGMIVPTVEPVEKLNLYWGYYVRRANTLSQVLKENIFVPDRKGFYDIIIGTSERGVCIDELKFRKSAHHDSSDSNNGNSNETAEGEMPAKKRQKGQDFKHILVVFGGVKGLEHSVACDKDLKNTTEVSSLFDYYINTCPNQGSTTIRTEEAILITMSALRPKLNL